MISWSKSKLAIGVVVLALMIATSTAIITPRPASADPLAGAIGGAIIGGLVTRRGGGVIAGAVIGGVVGGHCPAGTAEAQIQSTAPIHGRLSAGLPQRLSARAPQVLVCEPTKGHRRQFNSSKR